MYCSDQPAKWVGLRVGHLAFALWTSVLLAAVVIPLVVGHHHAMEKIIKKITPHNRLGFYNCSSMIEVFITGGLN